MNLLYTVKNEVRKFKSGIKGMALMLLLALSACATQPLQIEVPAPADPREQELRSVLTAIEPLVRNLLTCLNTGNYSGYVEDFDNGSQAILPEDRFRDFQTDIINKLGPYETGRYQAHKIELYASGYVAYYFVKFKKVDDLNPVIIALRIKKEAHMYKILAVSYKHPLLQAQGACCRSALSQSGDVCALSQAHYRQNCVFSCSAPGRISGAL